MINPLAHSLNGRLIAFFVAMSVVPLAALAVISFNSAQSAMGDKISAELQSLATSRAEGVKIVNEMRAQQATSFSTIEKVQEAFANPGRAEYQQPVKAEFEKFRQATGMEDGFYKFKMASSDGRVFISSDQSEVGSNLSQDARFQQAMSETVSFVEYDKEAKMGTRMILVPVRDGSSDALGVLYASVHTNVASQILLNREGLGESGETYLVNGYGLMISESRFVEGAGFNQVVNSLPVSECFENGKTVNGIYPDYRGIPVYGASACEKDAGFVLLAEYDVAEINAPVTNLQNQYLLIGGPMAGAVGVAAFFISRSVSRPIVSISNVARKVSEGDLTVDVQEMKSKDEIGRLSHSFTEMVKSIRDLVKETQTDSFTLSSTAEQLAASTEEVNASISQVSTSVQQIAKGTQDQAKRLEENNRTAEELKETMSGIYRNAEEVAAQATQTGRTAQSGQTAAADAAQRMSKIHEFVTKAVTDIKGISEKSVQIADALGVINSISDKTN
ncbi:MAG: methyl-accepting chemotaxis protein, partial [Nitrososphaera sp.]|uniref:methyl-accepting chemotaxis protein n=1 Tax=Nitrososphaera sp. TaxID=1971748 RepID=UPI003D6F6F93